MTLCRLLTYLLDTRHGKQHRVITVTHDAQGGNNNTYCHDSELNWFDWDMQKDDKSGFGRFFRHLVQLR